MLMQPSGTIGEAGGDSDAGISLSPALLATIPRDQAMGLRLIALARAAAAQHMSAVAAACAQGASPAHRLPVSARVARDTGVGA